MEDEKKKKRNKKKKNKQTKTTGDVTHSMGESANVDQNHVSENNHENQVLETEDGQNDVLKTNLDLDRNCTNGTEGPLLAEAEMLYLRDREASLEERIRNIQKENDALIQKEGTLEETIKRLQKENSTYMQKEAPLEMKLFQLQSEKDSWLQKEAGFEEKISQLIDDTTNLNLKRVSLEEKIKQLERERVLWVQKENSMKETIARLTGDNTRLQTQVMELEESRNSILRENQGLTESTSGLQSQIQNLENSITYACTSPLATMQASGSDGMNAQMETASRLVEKLVAENEELVEKVNELCVELDLQGVTADLPPAVGSLLTVGTAETFHVADPASGERLDSPKDVKIKDELNDGDDVNANNTSHVDSMSELSESTSLSGKRIESPEDVAIQIERENGEIYAKGTTTVPTSPDSDESEEIVQIPLDESEVEDPRLQLNRDDQNIDVPLTDSPLIGAPFRFVSFVARYVSGADLVNTSSVNSGKVNSRN